MHSYIIYGKARRFAEFPYLQSNSAGEQYQRVVNGLYSGSRATARDNTWIHKIDINIARHEMPEYLMGEDMLWVAICGDDEDAAFIGPVEAAMYYATLGACGHALNPVKQLAGYANHEFLQLTAARTVRVEKPLNTLLATLATGNWYVQLGTWLQTAIASVISNYWEMYCRGLVKQCARRLCVATLERLMVTRREVEGAEEHELLEWWAFRFSTEVEPLFDIIGDCKLVDMPRFEAIAEPNAAWGSLASKAYVRRNQQLLTHLPARIREEFVTTVQAQTIGAAYKVWQQKSAKRWCHENWPARVTDAGTAVDVNQSWKVIGADEVDMSEVRYGIPKKQQMLTEEAVAGMMGVPFFLARRLGGCEKLGGLVSLEKWSKYRDVSQQFIPLSGSGHELQMNIRAAMSWSTVPFAPYHGSKNDMYPRTLLYIYMGNGAGKTHICKLNRGVQDLDCVWMDAYGSVRAKERDAARKSTFNGLMRTMGELAQIAVGRGPTLLGQVHADTFVEAARRAGISVQLGMFDPGEGVREARLRTRDWPEDKIAKRLNASRYAYKIAGDMGATRLEGIADIMRLHHEAVASRARARTLTGVGQERIPAKYVFDRTEAVTRKLQIDEELHFSQHKQFHSETVLAY